MSQTKAQLVGGVGISTVGDLSVYGGVNVSGVVTPTSVSVSGNVSIAGTLTYEDVTNIDSIGIVTARAGAHVGTVSGNLLVGTTSDTGTASQPLQVTGGAYVSGSVGIGYTKPISRLEVGGDIGFPYGNGIYVSREAGPTSEGGNNTWSTGTSKLIVVDWNGSADRVRIYTPGSGSSTEKVTILSSGNIGITTTTPSEKLHVIGNILASGNVTGYSDETLKDNIQTIPDALSKVTQLRGVEFDRNDIEGNPHQIGVIAQEVEQVIPEVVTTHDDGIKSVAYGNLVGVLIEAIKELKEEINELKDRLEEV